MPYILFTAVVVDVWVIFMSSKLENMFAAVLDDSVRLIFKNIELLRSVFVISSALHCTYQFSQLVSANRVIGVLCTYLWDGLSWWLRAGVRVCRSAVVF